MTTEAIFTENIMICRGCDYISTIIMQNRYKFDSHLGEIYWHELVNLQHSIVRLTIYTEWATAQKRSRDIIDVFNSVPGKFGEQTRDQNLIGLAGKFSAILQEDSLGESEEFYLGIHIPNSLTKKFNFDAAHYELNLLGLKTEEQIEKTSILLAQGRIEVIGEFYE